ncbi:helix-turn-helix domain-containing protein [Cupriavidus sp. MP-37]|uniref:IclR family transcriptional regulator domain-containing protein n=1 Tax=Cupriavidus sp. MP-37 TaxID=2884455 RepID=UPI001D0A70F1|nr:helix-turn-helix domain-containing protein [Cupriavidus sp. MP-37]UDM53884.1 helix-turn-helix domain-containing protein [Cupriavidus sp. MP-37]
MWDPKVKTIAALDRGLAVLDAVRRTGGASLHALHDETGLPKATLLRILVTLERRTLIWRRIADGHYCPGSPPPTSRRQSDATDRLAQFAAPELDRLQAEILWPSDLAIRRGNAMVLCETNRAESYFTIRRDNIGFQVNMLRSAVGQAYLAFCPQKEREMILAALRRSRRDGDALARDPAYVSKSIERTRQRGYGVREQGFGGDYDKPRTEADDRLEALAVPIMGDKGRVHGCVNIVWIRGVRTPEQIVAQCLEPLRRTADAIGQAMSARR